MAQNQINMKNVVLFLALFFLLLRANAQTDPIFKNPVQDKRFQNHVSDFLETEISFYFNFFDFDSTYCTDYVNFIQFQIDDTGKVINLQNYLNQSNHILKVFQANNSLDSIRLSAINNAMDSIIRLTSGKWTPARRKDNTSCVSKKLLYIISYSYYGKCNKFLSPIFWNEDFSQVFNGRDVTLIGFFQGRRYIK